MNKKQIIGLSMIAGIGIGLCMGLCVESIHADDYTSKPQTATNLIQKDVVSLTLQSAVLMALQNNASFQVERIQSKLSQTDQKIQESAFDPILSASLKGEGSRPSTATEGETLYDIRDADRVSSDIRLKKLFSTGTTVEIGAGGSIQSIRNDLDKKNKDLNLELAVTQPLLQGAGSDVTLARLRSAQIGIEISTYELQAAAEGLVAQVEQAYWDDIMAEQSIEIHTKSLEIANQQVEEVKERIRVGKIAETELAAAEAEAASRHEQLIDARGTLAKRQLNLIQLLGQGNNENESSWSLEIKLNDAPQIPPLKLEDVKTYVQRALQNRPDINQARLKISQNDIELVRTRNGLLPKLDLFISLGGSRYATSFSDTIDRDGDSISYVTGLNFQMPLFNQNAKAVHEKSLLTNEQAKIALRNMEQLIQVDVRSAFVDVERMNEKMKATRVTRNLREKTLNIEVEKFRIGRSTTFLVSQARRDLVSSQIDEIQSMIEYRKALMNLYRLEGALLKRWRISL
ncbi:MAG: TolC family protein [Desulfobacterales bacterium]|nr:TolC family protein [Desulfobacterales bacterium]